MATTIAPDSDIPDAAPVAAPSARINWGQVVKGALIVTAVVAAAVVVSAYAPGIISSGLTALNESPVFGPILSTLHSGAVWAIHALSEASVVIGSFFSSLWTAIAPAATTTGVTHAALTTAQVTATSHALGAVTTGGTLAAGVALAAPAISHLQLVDHHSLHSAATPIADGGATLHDANNASYANMLNIKGAALTDALHQSSAGSNLETAHHAIDIARHSTHERHSTGSADTPEAAGPHAAQHERRTRANLLHAQKAQENWVDRVGDAGVSARKPAITPRDESFVKQESADAAKQNASLTTSAL